MSKSQICAVERPADRPALAQLLATLAETNTPHRATGFGKAPGNTTESGNAVVAIDTRQLNRVIDYPHADLTITVEAGITLGDLNQHLAKHGQMLPIDADPASTLGGLLATNHSGSRRLGYGTLRDYVIGIEYVDAQGKFVHGGGKVVKNVAGYDLMKMSIGALGQFGIISAVTLKILPIPAATADLVATLPPKANANLQATLATLVTWCRTTKTRPVAADFARGLDSNGNAVAQTLMARLTFAGDRNEVAWQVEQAQAEFSISISSSGVESMVSPLQLAPLASVDPAWSIVFDSAEDSEIKLMCRRSVLPKLVDRLSQQQPTARFLAYLGNGIVRLSDARLPNNATLETLVQDGLLEAWQVTRLADDHPQMNDMPTRWGRQPSASWDWARRLKQTLDPHDLCNPGGMFKQVSESQS